MTNSGSLQDLAASLDLEGLDSTATQREIEALCNEAKQHGVHGVCVMSSRLVVAERCLDGTSIKLICAVGYPSGGMDFDVKRYETEAAIDLGAQEIELAVNIGKLKDGDMAGALREWRDVVEAADELPVRILMPLEGLSAAELQEASRMIFDSGAAGLTLRIAEPVRPEIVEDLRDLLDAGLELKVSSPRLQPAAVKEWLLAGVIRFGTDRSIFSMLLVELDKWAGEGNVAHAHVF